MGEWDPDEVRRLFTSLEFRSLLDRLQEIGSKPKVEVAELDLREVTPDELARASPVGQARWRAPGRRPTTRASRRGRSRPGGAQAAFAPS